MVCGAGWMILMKRLLYCYSGWFVTGAQAAVGAVFFAPGALASDPRTWLSVPPSAWLGVMFLGICVSLGAFGLYNTALVQLPATRASMAINLVPAIAFLSGLVVLGEELTLAAGLRVRPDRSRRSDRPDRRSATGCWGVGIGAKGFW